MSDGSKIFQGGIYCVIPMGKIYNENILKAAHRKFYQLFKQDAEILREMTINQGIIYEIDKAIKEEMQTLKYANFQEVVTKKTASKTTGPLKEGVADADEEREMAWENIKNAIENSYGYAIYHNGRRVLQSVAPFVETKGGVSRVKQFFDLNRDKLPAIGSGGGGNRNNWNIVLAVAHNVAARLESQTAYPDKKFKGFSKTVILYWAQVIANVIRSKFGRVNQPVQYGYILSREGYEGQVFRSHQTP